MSIPNRIWVEIEHPRIGEPEDGQSADDGLTYNERGHARAAALGRMLTRLGCSYKEPVFWNENKCCYCFTTCTSGVYVEASDNGHWYNLDFFGSKPESKPEDNFPDKWMVGDIIEYRCNSDHAWSKGSRGYINRVQKVYHDKKAHEYQVFYTSPICEPGSYGDRHPPTWWTTPNDVIFIERPQGEPK